MEMGRQLRVAYREERESADFINVELLPDLFAICRIDPYGQINE